MSVSAGSRIGPYEIISPLGAGGMGEVWRARDTRLDRSVAIKVLPAEFAQNPELKSRFEREAKAISQLNHPHICTLHDVGNHEGIDYLVMELIEGDSLVDRLARGPLPLSDVLLYGAQIAEALHRAHRAGIVHRDLKPGNIMITKSGAKLLDFGLAKASAASSVPFDGATEQKPLTQEGTIVGTFQYMAPEQLEGEEADARTDIFAFGAVLYEMATGRRAFSGKTRTSLIAAIVSSEPAAVSQLQPLTPPALEQLIRDCLAKDREARVQSAHDIALQLRRIGDSTSSKKVAPARAWIAWGMAALMALAMTGSIVYHLRTREVPLPLRFTIQAPPETSIDGVPAISPDGRRIAFRVVSPNQPASLWLRSLDSLEARPLKGTEGALFAFWSPDGQKIGFTARGKLWRLDLADGRIGSIYEPVENLPAGASWNGDGVILFTPRVEGTLLRVSASGGPAAPVTPGAHDITYWPWFLPDGDHYIYCRENAGKEASGLYVGSLTSGKTKLILPGKDGFEISRAAYAAGYLYYVSGNLTGSLYAQPFDARKLETRGEPEKIDDEVEFYSPGRAAFAVSETGTLVYRKRGTPLVSQLTFVDRSGRKTGIVGDVAPYGDFHLSPDEQRIVFTRAEDNPSIWILDVLRGIASRAALEGWAFRPCWLPDSRSIVYAAATDGPPNVFLRRPGAASERLTRNGQQNYPMSVTPDGRYAVYDFHDPVTNIDIDAVPLVAPHASFAVVKSQFREEQGVVSPNGRWLAYASDESGTRQIYAVAFPGGGGRVQMSNGGGTSPRWSRDGRELFYLESATGRLAAVKVDESDGELRPSPPEILFSMRSAWFDVTRDGRFLITEERLNPAAPGLTVVMHGRSGVKEE